MKLRRRELMIELDSTKELPLVKAHLPFYEYLIASNYPIIIEGPDLFVLDLG